MLFVWGTVAVLGYTYYKNQKYAKEKVPQGQDLAAFLENKEANEEGVGSQDASQENSSRAISQQTTQQNTLQIENSKPLPKELNFAMAFYSQAPFGNWDYPWQEACEEASILLVANIYQQKKWSAEEFNDQILKLVEWEKKRFGSYEHTDVAQTALMLKEYLGLETVIHDNPTFEDVQKILNKGHLMVGTFAGKKLRNPFYTNGGPNYHAMVIKGYKEGNKIITADVGTRRGEDYVYHWSVIEDSLHDYAEPIEKGAKRLIEVLPPENP